LTVRVRAFAHPTWGTYAPRGGRILRGRFFRWPVPSIGDSSAEFGRGTCRSTWRADSNSSKISCGPLCLVHCPGHSCA
jgi:hypothetical protein